MKKMPLPVESARVPIEQPSEWLAGERSHLFLPRLDRVAVAREDEVPIAKQRTPQVSQTQRED